MSGQYPNKRQRRPRKPTSERIRRWALAFLSARDATSYHLRETLLRRARRGAQAHGVEDAVVVEAVDTVIASLNEIGLLDDARVGPARARSEARYAKSDMRIRQKLMSHGIEGDLLERSMGEALEEESEELRAFRYARRRRVGPYAAISTDDRRERDRQMARLARAGFPLDIIRKVMECRPEDLPDEVPALA